MNSSDVSDGDQQAPPTISDHTGNVARRCSSLRLDLRVWPAELPKWINRCGLRGPQSPPGSGLVVEHPPGLGMTSLLIRPSREDDLALISALEKASDARFRLAGMSGVAAAPAPDPRIYGNAHSSADC
jgi:hypothetical protein